MTLRIGLDNDGTYMTIIMVTSRAQASYSNIYTRRNKEKCRFACRSDEIDFRECR